MSGGGVQPVVPLGAMERALTEQERLRGEVETLARHVAALERLRVLEVEVGLWTR